MRMHALPLDSLHCPCGGRSRILLRKFENGSVASWRYLSKRPPLLYGHHFPLILMYMKVSYEWDALLSRFTTCTAAISETGSLSRDGVFVAFWHSGYRPTEWPTRENFPTALNMLITWSYWNYLPGASENFQPAGTDIPNHRPMGEKRARKTQMARQVTVIEGVPGHHYHMESISHLNISYMRYIQILGGIQIVLNTEQPQT